MPAVRRIGGSPLHNVSISPLGISGKVWMHISTFGGEPRYIAQTTGFAYPQLSTMMWRKPKKDRHLRGFRPTVSWGTVGGERSGTSGLGCRLPASSGGISGEIADATKGSGDRRSWRLTSPGRGDQSRVPSTPIRCLGVQCEGVVRDPLRLAALAVTNQVGQIIRPGDGSQGSRWPSRAAQQPTGGGGKKNGGATPDLG